MPDGKTKTACFGCAFMQSSVVRTNEEHTTSWILLTVSLPWEPLQPAKSISNFSENIQNVYSMTLSSVEIETPPEAPDVYMAAAALQRHDGTCSKQHYGHQLSRIRGQVTIISRILTICNFVHTRNVGLVKGHGRAPKDSWCHPLYILHICKTGPVRIR